MKYPLEKSIYERMGGEKTLHALVESFYDKVSIDPDLTPIFPDDLTSTREKQLKFLTQFFGGPSLYTQKHGHPMLRARHMPFTITPTRAKAWLSCMHQALSEQDIDNDLKDDMFRRLAFTAQHMVNTTDDEGNKQ